MSTLDSTPYASYAEHQTNADGTRFVSKPTGSQFAGTGGTYLRSCLVCSEHKPVTGGQFRRIAGRSQFVCNDACAVRIGFKPKAAAAH